VLARRNKKEIDAWQKQRSRVSDEITENHRELELVIERLKNEASGPGLTLPTSKRRCERERN